MSIIDFLLITFCAATPLASAQNRTEFNVLMPDGTQPPEALIVGERVELPDHSGVLTAATAIEAR
jgi:hypothetical protein